MTTTQNAQIYNNAQAGNGLSLFFFFVGAPHIYSILKQRQNQISNFQAKLMQPKTIGLVSATILATIGLYLQM